jgi:hypothetical protein
MIDIFELVAVFGIFTGMLLLLAFSLGLIRRFQLSKSTSQILFSSATGIIFGLGSLGFISLSEKFSDWTFTAKLIDAGKISLYVFIATLILSSIRINASTSQNNK